MYNSWIMKGLLASIDVRIIESRISNLTPSYWHKELDNRPYGRLYYIKKGAGYIRSYGKEYRLLPGHVYLVPPRGDFAYGCTNDLQIWWLHFTATILSCIDLFDHLPYNTDVVPREKMQFEKLLLRLIDIHGSERADEQLEYSGMLLQFLSMFFHDQEEKSLTQKQETRIRFLPVLKYIDEHLGEGIAIDTLAKMANYEKSHFSTVFSSLLGTPPSQYVIRKRVEQAQLMLRRSDIKLEALAEQLGFSDAFHLSKVFKRVTGHSPSEYRNMRREGMP
ncbi:MAG: hypothetical protein A2283_14335 [Lentisphaerae bacterium RIFOXYA12_FULL_48_11]|nr:MAG: hypothetical protein A2283_14335 [Lentisphaerae bacterium RIFOXYA12_FULL_48_11]